MQEENWDEINWDKNNISSEKQNNTERERLRTCVRKTVSTYK